MHQFESAAEDAAASQQSVHGSSLAAPGGFEAFYRDSYREVVRAAMIAGAKFWEAEDAASKTFLEMLERWPIQGAPLSYARTAVVHNFIKDKTRGSQRVVDRLTERDPAWVLQQEGTEDTKLCALEAQQRVEDVLSELTPSQREVMERIARGLDYEEIAAELGKSREVVRRRVCDARARLIQILDRDGTRLAQPRPATELPRQEEIE